MIIFDYKHNNLWYDSYNSFLKFNKYDTIFDLKRGLIDKKIITSETKILNLTDL